MSLLKSAGRVGALTLASRFLGFFRDQLIAFTFGTGWVADAFVVAQRLPNLFRALFAEGAFNNAFVPLFTRKHEGEGDAKAFQFSQDALSVMAFWMLIFCGAAMALPARSLTPVEMVAVKTVFSCSGADGVNVAMLPA